MLGGKTIVPMSSHIMMQICDVECFLVQSTLFSLQKLGVSFLQKKWCHTVIGNGPEGYHFEKYR